MNKENLIVYTNTDEEWWFYADPKTDVLNQFNKKMIADGSQLRGVDFYSVNCAPVEECVPW